MLHKRGCIEFPQKRKKKHTLKLHRLFLKPELIKHSFTPQIQVLNKSPSKFAYKYKNKDITPKNSYLRRPKNWRFFHFKCQKVLEFSPFAIDMLLLHIQTLWILTHKKNILLLHSLITTYEKQKYVSDVTSVISCFWEWQIFSVNTGSSKPCTKTTLNKNFLTF